MYTKPHRLFSLFMTLITITAVFCTAITLILYAVPLYDLAMEKLQIPESTGLPSEVIKRNYRVLVNYNLLWGSKKLVLPDFHSSPSGLAHFSDVKHLFRNIQILVIVTVPAGFIGYLISKRLHVYSWMRDTCIISLGIILGLSAGILLNAEATFVFMHKILFTNVYWKFNPGKDPVINILPPKFFLFAAIETIILIGIGLLILIIGYAVLKKKETPRKSAGKQRAKVRKNK